MNSNSQDAAASQRLYVFNGGFLTQGRVRRILELSGYDIKIGAPGAGDMVGIWGKSPTAPRGEKVADWRDAPILRVEDALLRSVLPGRSGSEPLGLLLDQRGVHFDPSQPSDLEDILANHPIDDTALLDRARRAMVRLREANISKYNAYDPGLAPPDPGYVLVVDQTRGDAAITHGGADANSFREMLVTARLDHPDAKLLIKTHPETQAGHREGYFDESDENDQVSLYDQPISPWRLLEHARAVYTVSSGLGFEAIFADHKPRVFGQPFYAGWGLTQDEFPLTRRQRNLTKAQLFAAAMILYPKWYDPYRDCLTDLETVIATLEAEARAWREDQHGYTAMGMRLWKRAPLQRFYGHYKRVRFDDRPSRAALTARVRGGRLMCWAKYADQRILSATAPSELLRVEDGFIRSAGLGAELTAPMSLVTDDLGIYYDPGNESRLEHLIRARADLPAPLQHRAERLIERLIKTGVSKYNLDQSQDVSAVLSTKKHRILVPGQVEDDQSIRLGAGDINTNLALLKAAREHAPDAFIIYKPHPDVEAGLRNGAIDSQALDQLADHVAHHADPIALIDAVDEVVTMTSLLGFEALIRNKIVTVTGMPFYTGWGLTNDVGMDAPPRRNTPVTLHALVYAALVDYPRYLDPVTGRPCPVEIVVDRLASGDIPAGTAPNRLLSKLQGIFAGYANFWRR